MDSRNTLPGNDFSPEEPTTSLGMSLAMVTTLTVVWAAELTVGLTLSLGDLVAGSARPSAHRTLVG
ncbi:hypothetical protein [Amycolatopsis sp. H20-H5]|uniref:hypothetical protein n=1 Tax=Amycolatopsis sp. H20-H5 TaxID=3046309 RepID=UPI002DBA2C3F|nr:hypothetical protein [Amycolatopsis sp. H20-H5]MEC3976019.1 hypothetical protein [Amycolatopsis sp. H20-H5]